MSTGAHMLIYPLRLHSTEGLQSRRLPLRKDCQEAISEIVEFDCIPHLREGSLFVGIVNNNVLYHAQKWSGGKNL